MPLKELCDNPEVHLHLAHLQRITTLLKREIVDPLRLAQVVVKSSRLMEVDRHLRLQRCGLLVHLQRGRNRMDLLGIPRVDQVVMDSWRHKVIKLLSSSQEGCKVDISVQRFSHSSLPLCLS